MGWLAGNNWFWLLLAAVLGSLVTLVLTLRKAEVVTESSRTHTLDGDVDAPAADVDGPGLGTAAGVGAASVGAAGVGLAASGDGAGSGADRFGDPDPEVDAPSAELDDPSYDVDAPSLDAGEVTLAGEGIAPVAPAPEPLFAEADAVSEIDPAEEVPEPDSFAVDTTDVSSDIATDRGLAAEESVDGPGATEADVDDADGVVEPSGSGDVAAVGAAAGAGGAAVAGTAVAAGARPDPLSDPYTPDEPAAADAGTAAAPTSGYAPAHLAATGAPGDDGGGADRGAAEGFGGSAVGGTAQISEGPFGPGSAEPLEDGGSPGAAYTIKGNADSRKFHTVQSPYYGRTKAEVWFDSEDAARAAAFHRWDEGGTDGVATLVEVPEGAFGKGSADPLEDGSAPSDAFAIKGNADSMLFHAPSSPYYGRTKAEVWFDSEESAREAGFRAWNER